MMAHGRAASWFAEPITAEDTGRFGIVIGDSRYQALLETLAILIGVRLWLPAWRCDRTVIALRSDSQAALGAVSSLKSSSAGINAIVRELALDLAEGRYRVDVVGHLPGEQNAWADALSRLRQPGSGATIPVDLLAVPRAHPGRRSASWWETVEAPAPEGGAASAAPAISQ